MSSSKASEQVTSVVSHESRNSDGQEKNVFIQTAIEEASIMERKAGVVSIEMRTGSSSFDLDPESGRDTQEAGLVPIKVSELEASEGVDKNTSLTASIQSLREEEVLATNNEMDEPFQDCKGVSSMDGITQHSAELGSFDAGHCASNQQKMDLSVQLPDKWENDHTEDVSTNQLKYESMPKMPLVRMEDNKGPVKSVDCADNTDIDSSSDMAMPSSSVDHSDTKNVEGCCDGSKVTEKEFGANIIADDVDVSAQVIPENLVQKQAGFSKREVDICKSEEADKKVASNLENIDSEYVGTPKDDPRTQLLEVNEEGNNSIHKLQPRISGELESAQSDSANTFSPLATNDASEALDDCPKFGQRDPSAIGSINLDNDHEDSGTKEIQGPEDENSSKFEVNVANDSVGIPLSETSAQPEQAVENISSIGVSSVEAVNSLHSDYTQAHSGCRQSSLKESADADLVSGDNHEKARTNEEEKESQQTPEIDKASCDSPTIISSSEPLLTEKDTHEEGRGYKVNSELVKDTKSISEDQKRNDSLGDDSSFTFKVNALPDTDNTELQTIGLRSLILRKASSLGRGKHYNVMEDTAPSAKAKTERTPTQKISCQNARVSDGVSGPGTSKGTSDRKGRRGPGKGTAKENAKKGNQSRGAIQENATGKVENISSILSSTPTSSPHAQFGQMQSHGNIEAINKKLSGAVAVPTSNLPDLNNSVLNNSTSQSASFRPPFSDLQQVQLRAQIFVYGSLIQGTAPDEACMVSAFGASDGGRSTWEPIWRVAVDRVRSQKSSSTAGETPRSQSGFRASDGGKQGSHSSKPLVTPTPASKANSKDTPGVVSNPIIPLSSPLWNISTPSRDTMPSNAMQKSPVDFQSVHSYQTPPIRNFVGHTSWPSQTCFPGSWLASPQTANFSSSARFHPVSMTETVKLTPIKDTSTVLASSVKPVTSSPTIHTVSPSPALGGVSPFHDSKMVCSTRTSDSFPGYYSPPSPIGVSASACVAADVSLSKHIADADKISSVGHTNKSDSDAGKAVACSEETLNKVAEAKSQAENAADLATAAVSHCEDLWSQLAKQRDSGLTSETEAKLASAAAAIAAAASVAKAAAATAKIACNAALQAKLMADEVFLSSKTSAALLSSGMSSNDMHDIGNATPASILKSNDVTNQPSSILVAAKEAAKRRVEAASAASRQAENLDAIVKAAELAAAAVSQAGKIVAMGEPLPLNELIEAGPEGYWKLAQSSAVITDKARDGNTEQSGAVGLEKVADIPASVPTEDSAEKGASRFASIDDVHLREKPSGSLNACMSVSDGIVRSQQTDEEFGMNHTASDTSKSDRVASEADDLEKNTNLKNERDEVAMRADDGVKEGSLVEVFNPGNGRKSAWYTANVLSLDDGKAFVCYNNLMSEEGMVIFVCWFTVLRSNLLLPVPLAVNINWHGYFFVIIKFKNVPSVVCFIDMLPKYWTTISLRHAEGTLKKAFGQVMDIHGGFEAKEKLFWRIVVIGNFWSVWWSVVAVFSMVLPSVGLFISGSGHLQEWVPLQDEAGRAPIIRAAHPLSSLQSQQTKKRRRAALGDYAWCAGDKVDVWVDDCWWEGVVTEKIDKDETTLKVHISAQGETSTVRAWNLRASRSWINGKWTECSSSKREIASEQSDTPQEKRQKLGTPLVVAKAKDKESNNTDAALGKPEQSKFLALSTSDRTFDIGKATNDDNKRAARRPLRTNQQKEGSRVVFGVPKPTGKKRKFMEVSKHFPASKSDKSSEVRDPVKFTKYLVPQGAASRSWKVPSRNDSKEKRTPAESRPRVLSTRKAHRNLPQKENSVSSLAQDSDKSMNHGTEDSVSHDETTSEKSVDHGSNACEEAAEAPLSSLLSHSLSTGSKKSSSSHTRSDRLNRGKLVPSGGKLSKIEEERACSVSTSKSSLDNSEPRRSNRRIQPTHRLLEGLQSSMVIPKMPSVSHDKGRSNRNLPARGNNIYGDMLS
ncbi:Melanoma-associated antigen D1 [Bienertia sinuspersici]